MNSTIEMDETQKVKAKLLVVIGSASRASSNAKLMEVFAALTTEDFDITLFDSLDALPHFDPSLSEALPFSVTDFFLQIESVDAVIFCSPEYIFGIPARVKNLLEWCVSTTVFLDKPVGLITASANGKQGHAQMRLIMQTLGARLSEATALIIPGIKGKFDQRGELIDHKLKVTLNRFGVNLTNLISGHETGI